MINKLGGIVLGGALFGATLAGSVDSAAAAAAFWVNGSNTSGSAYDTGVTPAGSTLRVSTTHSFGSVNAVHIWPSTPFITYSLYVSWACSGAGSNARTAQPTVSVTGGITQSCTSGWVTQSYTAFDDL